LNFLWYGLVYIIEVEKNGEFNSDICSRIRDFIRNSLHDDVA
jgi:hypothetical protein